MSCEHCDCPSCRREREDGARAAALHRMCEAWNWNASPEEIARDIARLDGRYEPDEVYAAMARFGFPDEQIGQVGRAYCAVANV